MEAQQRRELILMGYLLTRGSGTLWFPEGGEGNSSAAVLARFKAAIMAGMMVVMMRKRRRMQRSLQSRCS
jgi:hypothetical protein